MFKLEINYTLVPGTDKTNFPVMFSDLCGIPDNFWNTVTDASGLDIRFFSDQSKTLELNREIEYFNQSSKELRSWIQVPVLNGTTTGSNTAIYCDTGDGTVVNSTSIWSDIGAQTVLHFNDSTKDSVAVSNDPVPSTTPVYLDCTTGGRSMIFDSTSYLTYPTNIDFIGADNLCVEAWIKNSVDTGISNTLNRAAGCKNTYRKQIMFLLFTATNYLGTKIIGIIIENATSCSTSGSNTHHIAYYTNNNAYVNGEWVHVTVVSPNYEFYPRTVNLYINGSLTTTRIDYNSITTPDAKSTPLQKTVIGAQYAPLDGDPAWYKWPFIGELSEVRAFVSTAPFPFDADWVATNYNTQTDATNFITVTDFNPPGPGPAPSPVVIYRRRRKINSSF